RGKFLLKQLLHDLGYNLPLKSYVVFVNPEFAIYQDKPKHPIVHPSQIFRFIKMLNNTPSKLTKTHYKLAHTLFSIQIAEKHSGRLPAFDFAGLEKGSYCLNCYHLLVLRGRKVVCEKCKFGESIQSAIMRNIVEF